MIGLLTTDFALYHDLIMTLRQRALPFVSLTFQDEIPSSVNVVITSEAEANEVIFDNIVTCKEEDIDFVIDRALMKMDRSQTTIIIGIDPGDSIGIAIYCNRQLIRRFVMQSPEQATSFIRRYIEEMKPHDTIVRIGNGARLIRNRIINELPLGEILLEMVDEAQLPCADDDTEAASIIALSQGKEIMRDYSLEPKDGEIRELQRLSRVKNGNITISKKLARKVLQGELSLDDAIKYQQEKHQE